MIHLDKYNNYDAYCRIIIYDYYIDESFINDSLQKFFIEKYSNDIDKIKKYNMSINIKEYYKQHILKKYDLF